MAKVNVDIEVTVYCPDCEAEIKVLNPEEGKLVACVHCMENWELIEYEDGWGLLEEYFLCNCTGSEEDG